MDRKSRAAELSKPPQERATSVDVHQSPRCGDTIAPDWLATFLSKQEERDNKREQREQERERARDERHELSMRLFCETLDRCAHKSPSRAHSNGANDESSGPETQHTDTVTNVERTSTGQHAKTRPPEPMAADITLRELAAWRRSWEDFVELEQLDRLPGRQQRAMLRTSLSIEMRATLQLAIGIDNDDDITVTAILDRIQEHIRAKRNVTLDRVALEERKQEEGEPFDHFYMELREIANNADLCQQCLDDRLTTRIMSGIRDPETRRKLLAITPPPSLLTTVDICRSEESARNDEAALANNDKGHTKIDRIGKKTWQRSKTRNNATSKHNHRCGYCGKSAHKTRDECPARHSVCSVCKKMGHWATCCRQNNPQTKSTQQRVRFAYWTFWERKNTVAPRALRYNFIIMLMIASSQQHRQHQMQGPKPLLQGLIS